MLAKLLSGTIAATRGPLDDFWYRPVSSPSATGVTVDDVAALSQSTFWACLRVLSDSVGAIPWHVYKRSGSGDTQRDEKAKGEPWYHTLHNAPNIFQTPIDFKAMAVSHLILRGNFYARIVPPGGGWDYPQLVPLNPDRIEINQSESTGALTYIHKPVAGVEKEYFQWQIMHVKTVSTDGLKGLRPLEYAREVLGLGIAEVKHAGSLYGGGGFFKYFLKTSKRLGPQGRKNFREGWRDVHGDPSRFEPPILEDDMDIKTLGMSPEDTQLLESRKFNSYEVCQFLGVPPHLVYLLDRATFSNIEQQSIEFATIHLNPWLVRFEQAIQYQLPDNHFSEFSRDALIRGDIASRYEAYSKALQGRPFMVPNDARRLENMQPLDGWDEPIEPLNMAASGRQGEQNATPQQVEEPSIVEPVTQNIEPVIEDAARQIVSREIVGLRRRAAKAEDNRALYDSWSKDWFAKHAAAVGKILGPVYALSGAEIGDGAPENYCAESHAELMSADSITEKLDEWEQSKPTRLADAIKEQLCTNEF